MRFSLAVASLLPLVAAFHIPALIPQHRALPRSRYNNYEIGLYAADSPEAEAEAEELSDESSAAEESAAMKWAAQQKEDLAAEADPTDKSDRKKYVIVGAGWGGFGAAKALCESGIDADVTILDALPDPTGATPYLSKTGKPVEAGTRGFWKDYPNICELLAELGLEVRFLFMCQSSRHTYATETTHADDLLITIFLPLLHRKMMSLHHSQTLLSILPMVLRPRLLSLPTSSFQKQLARSPSSHNLLVRPFHNCLRHSGKYWQPSHCSKGCLWLIELLWWVSYLLPLIVLEVTRKCR